MRSAKRGVWPSVLLLFGLVFACVTAPGCACEPEGQVKSANVLPCRAQYDKLRVFPRRTSPLALMPGKTPVTFGVTDTGESAITIPLVVPPGRAGVEPSIAAYYRSNGGDFSISGASAITRCPKTISIDGTIREVDYSSDDDLVRRYEFGYEQSETTGRTRLVLARECGATGVCKPETRFQYANVHTEFEHIATTIAAPMSRLASYMLADFNGDGLDDLLSPDTTAFSTPTNPLTEWRVAKNQGNGFAAPKVAFTQEWSFVQDMR